MKNRYLASTKMRRVQRVRARVRDQERKRLSVFRSNQHIYAQIIDDSCHRTLLWSSSIEKNSGLVSTGNCQAAQWVGQQIAERALRSGITHVVFDRGGYRFHGRIKELAEAARRSGLCF